MDCHAFTEKLNRLLDTRQSPASDSELIAHAAACRKCSMAFEETLAMLEVIGRVHMVTPPAEFLSRLRAEAPGQPVLSTRSMWGDLAIRIVPALGCAALVYLAPPDVRQVLTNVIGLVSIYVIASRLLEPPLRGGEAG